MKQELTQALDEYLTLMEGDRATLDDFFTRHPEFVHELRPMVELAEQVRRVPQPLLDSSASGNGKRRMLEALAGKEHPQDASPAFLSRLIAWLNTPLEESRQVAVPRRAPFLRPATVGIALLILIIIGGVFLQSWFGMYVAQTATLEGVIGIVEVLPAGGDTWLPAVVGMRVNAGDRIRTEPLSAVTVTFFDGSTTELGAGAEIAVTQMRARRDGSGKVIVLHQWLGQTYNRVEKLLDPESHFEIETPSAVATVRGTEFALGVGVDGVTRVLVVEGAVGVEAEEEVVVVQAGYETVAQPHKPPMAARPAAAFITGVTDEESSSMPPGLTKTPQPPGLTKTPEPPGLTKTPQPPGLTRTPEPPGLTKTPEPPGQTKTPQPPGQTKTPEPLEEPKPEKPKPDKPPKKP